MLVWATVYQSKGQTGQDKILLHFQHFNLRTTPPIDPGGNIFEESSEICEIRFEQKSNYKIFILFLRKKFSVRLVIVEGIYKTFQSLFLLKATIHLLEPLFQGNVRCFTNQKQRDMNIQNDNCPWIEGLGGNGFQGFNISLGNPSLFHVLSYLKLGKKGNLQNKNTFRNYHLPLTFIWKSSLIS